MFRCGIAYPRFRWILPLLLLFAFIFDFIAVATTSGWVEDENAKTHYASMWKECRGRNNHWECWSLMKHGWAQAVAALMVIGLILLFIAFVISIVGMRNIRIDLLIATGVLLIFVVILQFIALIIYPVKFKEQIFEGQYFFTWAYGFGWGATILSLGCTILFCCMQNYEDELRGETKPRYFCS